MQSVFEFYIDVLRWFLSPLYVFANLLYTVFPSTIKMTEIFYKWHLFLFVSLLIFFKKIIDCITIYGFYVFFINWPLYH